VRPTPEPGPRTQGVRSIKRERKGGIAGLRYRLVEPGTREFEPKTVYSVNFMPLTDGFLKTQSIKGIPCVSVSTVIVERQMGCSVSRFRLKKQGFSLVELLVVAGVLSMLTLGVSTMLVNANKSSQGLYQKVLYIQTLAQIQDLARSQDGCKKLGFDVASGYKLPTDAEIAQLSVGTLNVAALGNSAVKRSLTDLVFPLPFDSSSGLSVNAYRITKLTQDAASPLVYQADLNLTVKRTHGAPFKPESLPLYLRLDDTTSRNVISCSAVPPVAGSSACGPDDLYDSGWVDSGTGANGAVTFNHNLGTTDTEVYLEYKGNSNVSIYGTAISAGQAKVWRMGMYVYWYNKTANQVSVFRYGQRDIAQYFRVVVRKTDCSS